MNGAEIEFLKPHYRRINARRLEHLMALNLPLQGRTVLETGAGIGDLTGFFLDRGCRVTSIEARDENIDVFQRDFDLLKDAASWSGRLEIVRGDLNDPAGLNIAPHEVVFSYGLLYHLSQPAVFLDWAASVCTDFLVLETVVNFEGDSSVQRAAEALHVTQAIDGRAVRPSRRFVFEKLKSGFEHVYLPKTQPRHEQFPLDWTGAPPHSGHTRAIFVASRRPIENPILGEDLPARQQR